MVRSRAQGTADLLRRGQDPEDTPGVFPLPEEVCGQGLGRGGLRWSRVPVAGTECPAQAQTAGFLGHVLRMPSLPTSSLRTGRRPAKVGCSDDVLLPYIIGVRPGRSRLRECGRRTWRLADLSSALAFPLDLGARPLCRRLRAVFLHCWRISMVCLALETVGS